MIDIHCHILPAVPGADDGSPSLEVSLDMLEAAQTNGITHIICTPHDSPDSIPDVRRIRDEFAPEAEKRGIALSCGMEYNFSHISWQNGDFLTLADTSFLLLEFDSPYLSAASENLLFELQKKQYKLIAAHPERIFRSLDPVRRLGELGVFFQLTAGSVIGRHGPGVAGFSREMIENGFCHYIASDAHNRSRTFRQASCRKLLEEFYGPAFTDTVFDENPERLLRNKSPRPAEAEKLSLFRRFCYQMRMKHL